MKGVSFGNIHSYDDLNLILAPFTPTPAEPQTNFLKVPGRDGYLDLTEANGEVKYNSREFVFTFTVAPGDALTFDERASEVANALNGLRCKITLDRDPDYYWFGRCAVDKYMQDKNIGKIEVKATVDPYKYKESAVSVDLVGDDDIVQINSDGTMVSDDVLYLKSGKYWLLNPVEVYFFSGIKNICVTMSGFLSVSYGAGSTERKYVSGGINYTVDLEQNALLLSEVEADTEFGADGISLTLENNGRKTVCPTITCESGNTLIAYDGEIYILQAGEQKILGIQLKEGSNTVAVTGTGTITFTWQEGVL